MARSYILMAGVVIPGLLHAAPVLASDELSPVALPDDAVAPQGIVASDRPLPEPAFGTVVLFGGADVADDTQLADVTGMADVREIQQTVNVRNTSTVAGNIINGDPTTGTISIDGASFSGFNGLALLNANTGNNVSINSAMNVNVAIQP